MKYARLMMVCIVPILAACDQRQDTTAPAAPQLAIVRETFEFDSPFILDAPHPCVEGEFVSLFGSVHHEITQTLNDNGNLTVKVTSDPQDVTGTGLPSGAAYTATGGTVQTERVKHNGQFDFKFRNVTRVKSDIPGYDFSVIETIRFKISATGEVVIDESTFEFQCQSE